MDQERISNIIETAARMGAGDLSILLSATSQDFGEDEVRMCTPLGSPNSQLWHLMSEAGWLERKEGPLPDGPVPLTAYSIRHDSREVVSRLAWICFEGVRRNVPPERIVQLARSNL